MDDLLHIQTNSNEWFIMILINIFYINSLRLLIDFKKIDKNLIKIINNITKINQELPIELLLIKFLRMDDKNEMIKMMIIKKDFTISIRYISNIYKLLKIRQLNLFKIDDNFYKNLNNYYEYYYNYYKGKADIYKTWKYEIGDIKEVDEIPQIILIHMNLNKDELDVMREIIHPNLKMEFDEFKDYIYLNEIYYKLETMIYLKDNHFLILFTHNKKGYSYDNYKKELKRFDWNSRVILFNYQKIMMVYSNS